LTRASNEDTHEFIIPDARRLSIEGITSRLLSEEGPTQM